MYYFTSVMFAKFAAKPKASVGVFLILLIIILFCGLWDDFNEFGVLQVTPWNRLVFCSSDVIHGIQILIPNCCGPMDCQRLVPEDVVSI